MKYHLKEIAEIVGGRFFGVDQCSKNICYDSRQLYSVENTMFIALSGDRIDGHSYIKECYDRGVRAFMVDEKFNKFEKFPEAGFVCCSETLTSLQHLAAHHRSLFKGEVVAIVGSNGKSIVKELAAQLYDGDEPFFRSPKSYNSQLGVALSLLMIKGDEKFVIIEAGISKPNEMEHLAKMIDPDIALLTNLGDAHSENFSDRISKLEEKLLICKGARCKKFIFKEKTFRHFPNSDYFRFYFSKFLPSKRDIKLIGWRAHDFRVEIPFLDRISKENTLHALTLLKTLHSLPENLNKKLQNLQRINMRMELREGVFGSQIINDSYNNDFGSFCAAISYMQSITASDRRKVVFLSDFPHSKESEVGIYGSVAKVVKEAGIDTIFTVGSALKRVKNIFKGVDFHHFNSVEELISVINPADFANSTILLKGARKYMFEKVLKAIELQHHNTILEVNIDNLIYNLNHYTSHIAKSVKIMAMVKASSYGCGTWEIAKALERAHVDFLAVAFADEGIKLRNNGVKANIVVLGSDPFSHRAMIEHSLEPEIHSLDVLDNFIMECKSMAASEYPIHLKIDSGMHRVGFKEQDIERLISILKRNNCVKIASIFSHLAGSDDPDLTEQTNAQIELFERLSSSIISNFNYHIDRHICNSAAISRFKEAHYDMVRLGIGLYGYGVDSKFLKPVASLKSVIVQISSRKKGESIGYGYREVLKRDSKIATIAIGYADGLRRALSCGGWSVDAKGVNAPIVGNICMDSTMIDITDAEIKVGDYVTIFGEKPTIKAMADHLNTIEYEILTDISFRVKRMYIKD